ncbi:hypothetical protein OKA05_06380 [Luteolibacter arcticus]|uniref:Uncharacterized protein n=1 Tax=Luteolibacter arcticus TaxID=1581411 RepID=A0ABT3GEY6_9BACT|nr:hypothetical protein [Luteolibacter arcticus]MCW1922171.1 hypothetical protein [Luteolibacter arcticus]
MEPSQEAFNWFVRRWQVRVFVAAFALPVPLFVLLDFVLRRDDDASAIVCGMIGGTLLLTCLLLQCWIKPQKRSRKPSPVTVRDTHGEAV